MKDKSITPGLSKINHILEESPTLTINDNDRNRLLPFFCTLIGKKLGIQFDFPQLKNGESLDSWFDNLAIQSNIRIHKVELKNEWCKKDCGIILGFYKNKPCMLTFNSKNHYILTSADEKPFVVSASTSHLENFGFIFIQPLSKMHSFKEFAQFTFKSIKKSIKMAFFIQFILSLVILFLPIVIGYFFSHIAEFSSPQRMQEFSIILLINALIYALLSINQTLLINYIRFKIQKKLEPAFWDKILKLPTQFFMQYNAGDIAFRASSIQLIQSMITQSILLSLFGWVMMVCAFFLMLYYSPFLALIAFIGFLFLISILYILNTRLVKAYREVYTALSKQAGFVFQIITGIVKFKASASEPLAFNLWSDYFSNYLKARYKTDKILVSIHTVNGSILITMSLILFCLYYYQQDNIPLANFIAFNTAFSLFFTALVTTSTFFSSFLEALPLFEKTMAIFNAPIEQKNKSTYKTNISGAIHIKNLSFRYALDEPVIFKNLNLDIKPGEKIGITGESGMGKTTLFRLLTGIEKPSKGQIYYDNIAMDMLNINRLRQQVGIVSQNSKLIPGSILENIIGNLKNLTRKDAWDIIYKLGFESIIKSFPMEMDTFINEGMQSLSGGEVQCLILARALVKKPKILLLDEATSALDSEHQARMQTFLSHYQTTQLIIAHRLSTLKYVDKIIVLEKGIITQSGTFEELLNQPGYFAQLAKLSMIDPFNA